MKSWRLAVLAAAVLALGLTAPSLRADDDKDRPPLSVTVSFGAGLNTAQPGNAANHHILPPKFEVRAGGVVNFAVAGFHWIFIYNPGTRREDINVPASGLFINDLNNLYYMGLCPGPPAPCASTFAPTSNAMNRVESVSFKNPGTYLVICNVRPHFLDGMSALIEVREKDDD